MDEFEIIVEIERPVQAVFEGLTNFDRMPDWNSSVIEVRWTKDKPIGEGTTATYVGKFLGRKFESESVITEYSPPTRLASKSTSGPIHIEVTNTLESLGTFTRVTSRFRGESRGFFKIAEPVAVKLAKRLFETSTDNLRRCWKRTYCDGAGSLNAPSRCRFFGAELPYLYGVRPTATCSWCCERFWV